nr:rab3 GTPase-activating protein catalytic subunit [Ipomoea batatas]GME03342.1 rab3 GTPase-activating protein catalytic subunit [Ipomoea batatas]
MRRERTSTLGLRFKHHTPVAASSENERHFRFFKVPPSPTPFTLVQICSPQCYPQIGTTQCYRRPPSEQHSARFCSSFLLKFRLVLAYPKLPSLEMEPSFVSRARTALHSAAAKAEKVFTDIKKYDPSIDPGMSTFHSGEMVAGSKFEGGTHNLSPGVRMTIETLKEVAKGHSEADIYATLKESNMDPNETFQKLYHQVNAEHFKIQVGDDSDQQSPETSTPRIVGNKDGPKGSNEGKSLRWKPPQIKAKQDWQDRLKSIRIGKREAEDTENSTMGLWHMQFLMKIYT